MALEILAGAVVGELLKIVSNTRDKITSFQSTLKRLEKTLQAIDRRLVDINRLNEELDISGQEMEDLIAVVKNGKLLVCKCSKISTFNFVKQVKYSKQLLDLDDDLLRYFMTTLSLDHFKNTKTILAKVNQMQTLMGEISVGRISHISNQTTEKPKEDGRMFVLKEAKKLYRENKKKDDVVMQIYKDFTRLNEDSRREEAGKLSTHSKKEEELVKLSEDSKEEEPAKLSTDPRIAQRQGLEDGVMRVRHFRGQVGKIVMQEHMARLYMLH